MKLNKFFSQPANQLYLLLIFALPLSVFAGIGLAGLLVIQTVSIIIFATDRKYLIEAYRQNKKFVYLLLAFLFFATISAVFSINQKYSINELSRVTALIIIGLALVAFAKKYPASAQLRNAFIGAFIFAILLVFIEIVSFGLIASSYRKLMGSEGLDNFRFIANLNRGACLFALMIWPAVLILLRKNKYQAFALWLATLLALLFMKSLSAKLAFILATVIFLGTIYLKTWFAKTVTFAMLFLLILFPFLAGGLKPIEVAERYSFLPESSVHRMHIWKFSTGKILENPVLGQGFAASRYVKDSDKNVVVATDGTTRKDWVYLPNHPHNISLQLLLETGVPAFLLMIIIINCIFYAANQVAGKKERATCLAVVTSYVIIELFGFSIWQYWWLACGFIAAGTTLAVIKNSKASR